MFTGKLEWSRERRLLTGKLELSREIRVPTGKLEWIQRIECLPVNWNGVESRLLTGKLEWSREGRVLTSKLEWSYLRLRVSQQSKLSLFSCPLLCRVAVLMVGS